MSKFDKKIILTCQNCGNKWPIWIKDEFNRANFKYCYDCTGFNRAKLIFFELNKKYPGYLEKLIASCYKLNSTKILAYKDLGFDIYKGVPIKVRKPIN